MKRRLRVLGLVLFVAGCTSAEDSATRLYDEARALENGGRLRESEERLTELLTNFPDAEVASRARSALEAVQAASEAAALDAMSEIGDAQEDFMRRERRYAQSIEELVFSLMLGEAPDAEAFGYRIRSRSTPAADGYTIIAEASDPSRRSFFRDRDGVMRWARGEPATPDSPPLD